jgi:hypothetical protein
VICSPQNTRHINNNKLRHANEPFLTYRARRKIHSRNKTRRHARVLQHWWQWPPSLQRKRIQIYITTRPPAPCLASAELSLSISSTADSYNIAQGPCMQRLDKWQLIDLRCWKGDAHLYERTASPLRNQVKAQTRSMSGGAQKTHTRTRAHAHAHPGCDTHTPTHQSSRVLHKCQTSADSLDSPLSVPLRQRSGMSLWDNRAAGPMQEAAECSRSALAHSRTVTSTCSPNATM